MITKVVISSIALLLLGVCVRWSLRLLYGARGPAPDDGVHMTLRIVGWTLIIMPTIVLALVGANWLSLILIAAVVEAGIELVLARRAAQRQAVWRLVTGAVGSGRSLTDALKYHQRRSLALSAAPNGDCSTTWSAASTGARRSGAIDRPYRARRRRSPPWSIAARGPALSLPTSTSCATPRTSS